MITTKQHDQAPAGAELDREVTDRFSKTFAADPIAFPVGRWSPSTNLDQAMKLLVEATSCFVLNAHFMTKTAGVIVDGAGSNYHVGAVRMDEAGMDDEKAIALSICRALKSAGDELARRERIAEERREKEQEQHED